MGRTHPVPRNVKGESRILIIFSVKSLLFTVGFGLVGALFYLIFSSMGLGTVGVICVGVFAIVGYIVGALVIPDSPLLGNLRKAGGEAVSDILLRAITFKKRKKIYLYRKDGK